MFVGTSTMKMIVKDHVCAVMGVSSMKACGCYVTFETSFCRLVHCKLIIVGRFLQVIVTSKLQSLLCLQQ